jgi:lactate dehydrogenase-like 2-hydroxyacid dehydrogenase
MPIRIPTTETESSTRKPRVFTREALHSEGLALAKKHFDLVLHDDPEQSKWLEEAEGVLLRNSVMSEDDVKTLAGNKLKYVSKQGTGVDNIAADALKAHGIPLMNTPGVNVSC